jgi:aminoglycoside phosphotransferase (APT) family kinase protein
VRFPRIASAVDQIDKESTWLPRIAADLPVEVPAVHARGLPADDYPWPWLVYGWLAGQTALDESAVDGTALAEDLARFVIALQRLPIVDPPPAGYRAGPLAPEDGAVRAALHELRDEIDYDRAVPLWTAAAAAPPWHRAPVWVHGDLLPGNLVLRDGRLTGVIDWAAAGVGDPACDLMIAWALDPAARDRFRAATDIDDATWLRGMGWTLQQAALFIPYYRLTLPQAVAAARGRLIAVLQGDRAP